MDERMFLSLVEMRRQEAERILGRPVPVTTDLGEYEHFHTPRGFGVTFIEGRVCRMRYAHKCLREPIHRTDAIIRHELGHVIDAQQPKAWLDAWARKRGVELPRTDERRADALARAVWGLPIKYDKYHVQSLVHGRVGRPSHLSQ